MNSQLSPTFDAPWLIMETVMPSWMNTLNVRIRISLVRSTLQMSDRMLMSERTRTLAIFSSSYTKWFNSSPTWEQARRGQLLEVFGFGGNKAS